MRAPHIPLADLLLDRPDLVRVLHSRTDRSAGPDACWPFSTLDNDGYGRVSVRTEHGRLLHLRAHRIAHYLATGEEPIVVRHRCDFPACANPAHLLGGTVRDNALDAVERGRVTRYEALKSHCPAGHPYDEVNTYVAKNGHRFCRACRSAAQLRYVARRKVAV